MDLFCYRNIGVLDFKELELEEEKLVIFDKIEYIIFIKGKVGKAFKEDKKEKEDKKGERKKSVEKWIGIGIVKIFFRRNLM